VYSAALGDGPLVAGLRPIVIRITYGEANYQTDANVQRSRKPREDKRFKPMLAVEVWKRATHGLAAQTRISGYHGKQAHDGLKAPW